MTHRPDLKPHLWVWAVFSASCSRSWVLTDWVQTVQPSSILKWDFSAGRPQGCPLNGFESYSSEINTFSPFRPSCTVLEENIATFSSLNWTTSEEILASSKETEMFEAGERKEAWAWTGDRVRADSAWWSRWNVCCGAVGLKTSLPPTLQSNYLKTNTTLKHSPCLKWHGTAHTCTHTHTQNTAFP